MWTALRRLWNFFLVGFIVVFVGYLFFKLDRYELLLGLVLGAAGGLALSVGIFMLERRFPDRSAPDQ